MRITHHDVPVSFGFGTKVWTTAIGPHLNETFGRPTARLFELRCYEDKP